MRRETEDRRVNEYGSNEDGRIERSRAVRRQNRETLNQGEREGQKGEEADKSQ